MIAEKEILGSKCSLHPLVKTKVFGAYNARVTFRREIKDNVNLPSQCAVNHIIIVFHK